MASKTPKILKQSKELLQENPQQFLQKTNIFLEKYPQSENKFSQKQTQKHQPISIFSSFFLKMTKRIIQLQFQFIPFMYVNDTYK